MTAKRSFTRISLALTLLAVPLWGCAGPGNSVKAPAVKQAVTPLTGKVVETMDAGGYTYVLLEKEGKKTWVAAPTMKVTVGQELALLPGAEMNNFPSKALDRTFDKIIFSGGVMPTPGAPAAKDAGKASDEMIMSGKVAETMNAAAYTYIRLEKDGKSAWAAVPKTDVVVGDEVELQPGTPMGTFASKSMNRTFDAIYFSSGLTKKGDSGHTAEKPAEKAAADAAAAAGLPAGHPKFDQNSVKAPVAAPAPEIIHGKVVETMDAGGYTYICLEQDGKKTWAAIPRTSVKVGEEQSLLPGAVMHNFTSKSLNRTFESIVFSNGQAK